MKVSPYAEASTLSQRLANQIDPDSRSFGHVADHGDGKSDVWTLDVDRDPSLSPSAVSARRFVSRLVTKYQCSSAATTIFAGADNLVGCDLTVAIPMGTIVLRPRPFRFTTKLSHLAIAPLRATECVRCVHLVRHPAELYFSRPAAFSMFTRACKGRSRS